MLPDLSQLTLASPGRDCCIPTGVRFRAGSSLDVTCVLCHRPLYGITPPPTAPSRKKPRGDPSSPKTPAARRREQVAREMAGKRTAYDAQSSDAPPDESPDESPTELHVLKGDVVALKCSHVFHVNCLMDHIFPVAVRRGDRGLVTIWDDEQKVARDHVEAARANTACPKCRFELTKSDVADLQMTPAEKQTFFEDQRVSIRRAAQLEAQHRHEARLAKLALLNAAVRLAQDELLQAPWSPRPRNPDYDEQWPRDTTAESSLAEGCYQHVAYPMRIQQKAPTDTSFALLQQAQRWAETEVAALLAARGASVFGGAFCLRWCLSWRKTTRVEHGRANDAVALVLLERPLRHLFEGAYLRTLEAGDGEEAGSTGHILAAGQQATRWMNDVPRPNAIRDALFPEQTCEKVHYDELVGDGMYPTLLSSARGRHGRLARPPFPLHLGETPQDLRRLDAEIGLFCYSLSREWHSRDDVALQVDLWSAWAERERLRVCARVVVRLFSEPLTDATNRNARFSSLWALLGRGELGVANPFEVMDALGLLDGGLATARPMLLVEALDRPGDQQRRLLFDEFRARLLVEGAEVSWNAQHVSSFVASVGDWDRRASNAIVKKLDALKEDAAIEFARAVVVEKLSATHPYAGFELQTLKDDQDDTRRAKTELLERLVSQSTTGASSSRVLASDTRLAAQAACETELSLRNDAAETLFFQRVFRERAQATANADTPEQASDTSSEES